MIIALEGIDGSGKGTALKNVVTVLQNRGVRVDALSFPRYGKTPASHIIASFLNSKEMRHNPYYIAAAFAMDRHESLKLLQDAGDLIICDRYVASNVAFQAARLPADERDEFIEWITDFEFVKLAVPRPDLVIYFDIDVDAAAALIAGKGARLYTQEKYDSFERDRAYQAAVAAAYRRLLETDAFSKWMKVDVMRNAALRPPEDVANNVLKIIEAHFPDAAASS